MTNEKKSTRNDGRKTLAIGKLGFFNEGRFEDFEIEIDYTRSETIASEKVREALELANDVMVQVTELQQTEIKKTVYNSGKVFENMSADFDDEEIAKAKATETQTVIPYTMYEYVAQFWAVNSDGEYITDYVMDNSPVKFTRVNMRQFLVISAENLEPSYKVLAIHGEKRTETTRFAIVENDKLPLCVKES